MANQEIELPLIAKYSHHDGFGKSGVARIEAGAFIAQKVGRVAAMLNLF
jgi:hypothetical protein